MPAHPPADLEDDRILIDIQTEMALQKMVMESALKTHKSPIPQFLKEGRTLGPLSLLVMLLIYYVWLSPMLSPPVHEYINRILH
ncbi:MAG: hypothetical protein WA474_02950 [Candidatus Sulfotelmatobacter sp.]